MVQGQALDRGTPDARQPFQPQAIHRPPEVAGPALPAGIEERHGYLRRWVQAGLESQLLKLAGIATQGQITQGSRTAGTFRHDMVQAQAMRKKLSGA